MEQELIYKNVAIIGCGASGGLAGILLCKNPYINVTSFDTKEPFSTLLPTGGGRCNLTYDEEDVREFVKNYPRGEKFLISIFSRFGQKKTRELFKDLGIKTYVQEDKRVFPVSNSSQKTIQILQKHLQTQNFQHKKEKVIKIKKNENFEITTDKAIYIFDYVIIATGGHGNGFELAKSLGHNIIEPKPSLCAINIEEDYLYKLSGLSFKNTEIKLNIGKQKFPTINGDMLFSHKSITGPAIFKVSALTAYENIENLEMTINLTRKNKDEIEEYIKANQRKTIKNIFSKFAPESYISAILEENKIEGNKQVSQIKKQEKELLINALISLKLHAKGRIKDSEIVTAGGIDLKEIDSKTMQSKLINNLYFTGEILNIDAYTGGFNLQNCWSTAYIVSQSLN